MRYTAIVLFLSLLSVSSLLAADNADTNRGFSPNTAFSGGDIDHINLFNGNLIVEIPLAAQFPLNGGASYVIHLIYTGLPWDFPVQGDGFHKLVPNRRSNAGLGWRVSIGRLILPSDVTNPTNPCNDVCPADSSGYVYESPDGSDHVFYTRMHAGDAVVANVFYTRDSSYLRMKGYGSSFEIEFPDGMIHSFNASDGMLTGIRTPFDASYDASVNVVNHPTNVTNVCNDSAATSCWELDDRFGRRQFVTFGDTPNLYSGKLLRQIIVTAFGNTTATYSTAYDGGGSDTTLWTDKYCGYHPSTQTPANYAVPILTSISLPDGSSYTPTIYDVDTTNLSPDDTSQVACQQGSLYSLTLPTRGRLQYTYRHYLHHKTRDDNTPFIAGVATRKLITAANVESVWTYTPTSGAASPQNTNGTCETCNEYRELKVTVQIPEGHQFSHYFSIAQHDDYTDSTDWHAGEYGLPFTHRVSTSRSDEGVTRFLSSEVVSASGTPVRSSYVLYENDGNFANADRAEDDNRRMKSSVTTYNDGSSSYALTTSSDFDGLGHYRTTTTSGNFSGSNVRTITTNYNRRDADVDPNGLPDVGTYGTNFTMLAPTDPWILNTYTSQTTTEGTQTGKTLYWFERSTGFLKRRRGIRGTQQADGSWSGTTLQSTDLVQRFTHDTGGNLTEEEYFGGDAASLGMTPLSSLTLGTPTYRLDHTYDVGVRKTSTYMDASGHSVGYNILDNTDANLGSGIDLNTGLVKFSKDTAGVVTKYEYDSLRRLTAARPAYGCSSQPCPAPTTYTYTNASSNAPAQVDVNRTSAGASGAVKLQIQYDDFGRVVLEKKWLPSNAWSSRQTSYTGSGWKASVSAWETALSHFTTFGNYDPFGRAQTITAPDGRVTNLTFFGVRQLERTVTIGAANTPSTTREIYDRFGRLSQVIEPGTDGTLSSPNSTTTYTYDVANRLATSKMTAGNVDQWRKFRYDNAGLLIKEQHPENGEITYGGYDARGHVGTKRLATQTPYDLNYSYDNAEHLVRIDSRQSWPLDTSQFRPSKIFNYAFVNDGANLTNGKLGSSVRKNYLSAVGEVDVTESYVYADSSGHLTSKDTTITRVSGQNTTALQTLHETVAYNDLDEVATRGYPACQLVPCGERTSDTVTEQHTNGYLTGVSGFADNGIVPAPSDAVASVTHSNGIQDVYSQDPTAIPRPASITFGSYASCNAPNITGPPANQRILYNTSATLTVTASGTAPLSYQWYDGGNHPIQNATGASFNTGPLLTTTTYSVHVFNDCGMKSATVTVTVAFATPTNLVATANGVTQIDVSWGASSGAHHYEVWRKSNGIDWHVIDVNSNSWTDNTVNLNTTYVYHVRAVDASGGTASDFSNNDLSTTKNFTPLTQYQTTVQAAHFDELLAAVNCVRAANGSAALTWSNLFSAGTEPAVGHLILATHITALRVKMDEALTALGLPTTAYATDPTINNTVLIKKAHVTELRDRTQ